MNEIELYRVAKEIGIQAELKSKFENTKGDESKYTLGQMLLKLEFEDSANNDLLHELYRGKQFFLKALNEEEKKQATNATILPHKKIGKDIKALKKTLSILLELGVAEDTTRRIRNTEGEIVNYNATYDYAKIQHIAPIPWLKINVEKSKLFSKGHPVKYAFTPVETYLNIVEIIHSLEKTVKLTKTVKDKGKLSQTLQATTDGANRYLSNAYDVTSDQYRIQVRERFLKKHTITPTKKRAFITLINQFFKTIK